VEDVEWGYNRDREKLPQINVCMLMGEQSRLPVYQTVYSGSIKDVSTLAATVRQTTCHMADGDEILIVMDKGFFSKKNVDTMLEGELTCRFILPVPFTSKFAKAQIASERKDIDTVQNTIVSGRDTLRAVTKERSWGDGHKLHTHIYFNAARAALKRDELYAHVASLRNIAESGAWDRALDSDINNYLIVRSSQKAEGGRTVSIRQDALDRELETVGWMVLISNHVKDCRRAIEIYRAKDVVEKGFMRLKE
jgi:transposase